MDLELINQLKLRLSERKELESLLKSFYDELNYIQTNLKQLFTRMVQLETNNNDAVELETVVQKKHNFESALTKVNEKIRIIEEKMVQIDQIEKEYDQHFENLVKESIKTSNLDFKNISRINNEINNYLTKIDRIYDSLTISKEVIHVLKKHASGINELQNISRLDAYDIPIVDSIFNHLKFFKARKKDKGLGELYRTVAKFNESLKQINNQLYYRVFVSTLSSLGDFMFDYSIYDIDYIDHVSREGRELNRAAKDLMNIIKELKHYLKDYRLKIEALRDERERLVK